MKRFWLFIGVLAVLTLVVWLPSRNRGDRLVPRSRPPASSASAPPASAPSGEAVASLIKDLDAAYKSRADAATAPKPAAEPTALAAAAPAGAHVPKVAAMPDKTGATHGTMVFSDQEPEIRHNADGSMLIDGRFTVRGTGTEQDPYRIPWELLVSAQETYSPRLDMYDMPSRIAFLDGKHVQISGYLFVPMYRAETSELVVMRNMWDGCCIGVPPTSYDAIEVKLKQPISMKERRFATTGVLSGTLKVDPYLQGNWLLGLYLVEDGTVDFEI